MNSYKLNGIAGHITRNAIVKKLNINPSKIYQEVKLITFDGIVETKDGKTYKIVMVEFNNTYRGGEQ